MNGRDSERNLEILLNEIRPAESKLFVDIDSTYAINTLNKIHQIAIVLKKS